jgi:hypothetical protein
VTSTCLRRRFACDLFFLKQMSRTEPRRWVVTSSGTARKIFSTSAAEQFDTSIRRIRLAWWVMNRRRLLRDESWLGAAHSLARDASSTASSRHASLSRGKLMSRTTEYMLRGQTMLAAQSRSMTCQGASNCSRKAGLAAQRNCWRNIPIALIDPIERSFECYRLWVLKKSL